MVARDQMVGPWQVPVADCAVTTVSYDSLAGEAMAMGREDAPGPDRWSPPPGAWPWLRRSPILPRLPYRNHLQDVRLSANWMCAAGYGREDETLFDTVRAVGMEFCTALGITIPVGKDSMSMRTTWSDAVGDKAVTAPVSLIVSAFAPVLDAAKSVTPQLQDVDGDTCLLLIDLGEGRQRLGGSALAQVYGQVGERAPDVENRSASPACSTWCSNYWRMGTCWPITTAPMVACW